jgi:hypothetical protein
MRGARDRRGTVLQAAGDVVRVVRLPAGVPQGRAEDSGDFGEIALTSEVSKPATQTRGWLFSSSRKIFSLVLFWSLEWS